MFKKVTFLTILALCCTDVMHSQHLALKDIPITRANDSLFLSNLGGLGAPQYSPIDLNNDGRKDLLVYDRAAQAAFTLLNIGTAGAVKYRFAPEYMDAFPQGTINFMLARDYNGDGIEDLFFFNQDASGTQGIGAMRGQYDSNGKIKFTTAKSFLTYDFPAYGLTNQYMFVFNPDLPEFSDVDGDGDLDVMAFALDFTFLNNVYFHRNLSQERGHGADSLIFTLENQCYGQFSEAGSGNTIVMSGTTDSCGGNMYWRYNPPTPRHMAGSTLTFWDFDGDGHKDILMGDMENRHLNLITVTEIADTAVAIAQNARFADVDILSLPAAYMADVDNDGLTDMLVATNETSRGSTVTDSTTWFYRNTGTAASPQFGATPQKDFIFNQQLDFGVDAHPTIVDVNGDNLLDIVVGNNYNVSNDSVQTKGIYVLLNVGTATRPAFALQASPLISTSTITQTALYPTFGDLDGDGDDDLLIGLNDGTIAYAMNIAGAGQPMAFSGIQHNYANINIGSYAAPQLFDLNKDGDLDIIVGEYNGVLNYFENTGTPNSPVFSSTPSSNSLGLISLISSGSSRSVPFFYDKNDTTELYLGHDLGGVLQFGNIDNNLTGKFDTTSVLYQNIYTGRCSAPAVADINSDGIADMVVGNVRGGLMFAMSDTARTPTGIIDWSADLDRIAIFPNPSVEYTTINCKSASITTATINIYSPLGILVRTETKPAGLSSYQIYVGDLQAGIYTIEILRDNTRRVYLFTVTK